MGRIWNAMQEKKPLVHCMVGGVAMRDCANLLLAAGARPIMAVSPEESAEVTSRADSLLLNLGTNTPGSLQAMEYSARTAKQLGIPLVFDAVGAGISNLRRSFCHMVLEEFQPAVIKGNSSEIRCLLGLTSRARGVDEAAGEGGSPDLLTHASSFANTHKAVLFITGKDDFIIAPGLEYRVTGGHPFLGQITASGCMAGALCAALCPMAGGLEAALTASIAMKLAGEAAAAGAQGPGSFSPAFFDCIYAVDPNQLTQRKERILYEAQL